MGSPAAPDRVAATHEAAEDWTVWGLAARLVVSPANHLAAARRLADRELAAVTTACSRFEPDSELSILNAAPRPADGLELSPLLAEYVAVALDVARRTGGAVDPGLGSDLEGLGYDRDLADLEPVRAGGTAVPVTVSVARSPRWESVMLTGRRLRLPDDVRLDLGATAKAHTADRIAALVAAETGADVLVSLGGDIATAGPGLRRWEVLVQDLPDDPATVVSLPSGAGVATSSTQKRRWSEGGAVRHHILDPRFGLPVEPVWRSVSAAARTCLDANALTTAAVVKGRDAVAWLEARSADARLVARDGSVVTTGRWPEESRP
ncbi:FAD:protein FMN transferase [Leifsonia sp. AG29]|uniref:FAD:protein FMN transferase n=1 Tax=Leifsonia sp. AG29 TaxID=2598860 RepID=UPI00131D1780|nr:FAD:protein FMN transferase [Leifsonia sp. AG29]